ncbi:MULTISPECIES: universal stress protein [Bacillus]|uniref:Universal stress protein n=1 Tax=Bacillus pseudomycoides TaxID=64104 RepID=A0AAJ1Z0I9_9BACI|nr:MULTISPECIES: universal stress protein [Bacillus]AIK36476.1 universal stress family protein [Bacillus pseudomycoides]AJI16452.1 universal stress family protein [Bacillus pseudomycoides]EEM06869.1 Universal stress protein [Bacillus pseudomycoides]EEM12645.1 Universal stress protein [Bacillus pseudomycoides]KFN15544.1 universal stress family protein [Bacillus pseudomycoides]
MYKQIILACDGSEHAIRAAKHAVHISTLSKEVTVEVVYVVDSRTAKSDIIQGQTNIETISASRKDRLKEIEILLQQEGVSYKITILHGDPGNTLVQYVNTGDIDLVIVGSRGLNTLQEMVLGSVSHKIAKRVKCPVMIVK